jgi:hypothetical protein
VTAGRIATPAAWTEEQVVAERAVGIEAGLAAALDEARVEHRPELDRAGDSCGSAGALLRAKPDGCRRKPGSEAAREADIQEDGEELDERLKP